MKKALLITAIMVIASVLKSQDIDAGWYLFPDTSNVDKYWGLTSVVEANDGNYVMPMYSYSNYCKSNDKFHILKISADGVLIDKMDFDIENDYLLNDIVLDTWNDTINVFLHYIGVHRNCSKIMHSYVLQDFTLTGFREIWSADFEKPMTTDLLGNFRPLIDNEGNRTISYTYSSDEVSNVYPEYGKILFLKLDVSCNVIFEKWLDCSELNYDHMSMVCYTFNEDTTNYNVMLKLDKSPWNCQYVLDNEFNLIDTLYYEKESGMNYWEFSDQQAYSQNPNNGKIYCMTHVAHPTMKYELAVFMLDKTNMKVKMMQCTDTPDNICNTTGLGNFLAYSKKGDIYGMGIYDWDYHSNNSAKYECKLYLVRFDENLKKLDEWFYEIEEEYLHYFDHIYCTETDDIVVTGRVVKDRIGKPCIVKFPASAFNPDNIEEAHAHGLHLAVAYPNPGGDVMNIRTGLRNAVLTVYDINGRKIHEQELADDVTSVDASNWQSGTYVWKLGIRNEELGMKEVESGKWVK